MASQFDTAAATHVTTTTAVKVVAALIWRGDRVLVQQRPLSARQLPGMWEFPGGKVEPGESDGEALRRECFEELGVDVAVGPLVWQKTAGPVWLRLYQAEMDDTAVPEPHAAARLDWYTWAELRNMPFCPADEALITMREPPGRCLSSINGTVL